MENKIVLSYYAQWRMLVDDWINRNLNAISDNDFDTYICNDSRHGRFLLGHMVVSDDDFSVYMGMGDYLYPELRELFKINAKCLPPFEYPSVSDLKIAWGKVCKKNEKIYRQLTDIVLTEPHALCEDGKNDYFKTKERVIQAWQLYQAHIAGQFALLVSKIKKPDGEV